MYIVLGGTGQVGSAVARALLSRGEPVTVVTRDAQHAAALAAAGAAVAVQDIHNVAGLRSLFRSGKRAFLLNPPADPAGDTDRVERATASAIIDALDGSGLEKIVAASTFGARPGERCGDLTVLHEFEQKLKAQPIPVAINRGAYYMSNWAGMLEVARTEGKLPSFFPADLEMPMVAPEDLGHLAALRLLSPTTDVGIRHVEGPRRYTAQDVAKAISDMLGRPIAVETIPRTAWQDTFRAFGFSPEAAASYSCMTAAVIAEEYAPADQSLRGTIMLEDYVRQSLDDG